MKEPLTFDPGTGRTSQKRNRQEPGTPEIVRRQPGSGEPGPASELPTAVPVSRAALGNLPPLAEIEAFEGNYIISFGFPGAGKSCFQSFLARWINEGGDFVPYVGKTDSDDKSTRLINIWREDWRQNRFPDRTQKGRQNITVLRLEAKPNSGRHDPVTFGFLEMSGEDQRMVIPTEDAPGFMDAALRSLFNNPKIKPVLALFVDPEQTANDTIFMNLLDYLDANFGRKAMERVALLLLVPKPMTALAVMRRLPEVRTQVGNLDHIDVLDTSLTELFLETTVPATYQRMTNWSGKWAFARFYLGDPVEGDNTRYENVSFDDMQKIFSWLYECFVGKSLGPTSWQNMLRFFSAPE